MTSVEQENTRLNMKVPSSSRIVVAQLYMRRENIASDYVAGQRTRTERLWTPYGNREMPKITFSLCDLAAARALTRGGTAGHQAERLGVQRSATASPEDVEIWSGASPGIGAWVPYERTRGRIVLINEVAPSGPPSRQDLCGAGVHAAPHAVAAGRVRSGSGGQKGH